MDKVVIELTQAEAQMLAQLFSLVVRSGGLGSKEAQFGLQKLAEAIQAQKVE